MSESDVQMESFLQMTGNWGAGIFVGDIFYWAKYMVDLDHAGKLLGITAVESGKKCKTNALKDRGRPRKDLDRFESWARNNRIKRLT